MTTEYQHFLLPLHESRANHPTHKSSPRQHHHHHRCLLSIVFKMDTILNGIYGNLVILAVPTTFYWKESSRIFHGNYSNVILQGIITNTKKLFYGSRLLRHQPGLFINPNYPQIHLNTHRKIQHWFKKWFSSWGRVHCQHRYIIMLYIYNDNTNYVAGANEY